MHVAGALAALAMAGEPQCPNSLDSCYYTYSDAAFGNPWYRIQDVAAPYERTITGTIKENVCNKYNWLMREQCHQDCPLRLVVTEPPELRMTVCAMDNVFGPYEPTAHLDLEHPLQNKEMDIVSPGTGNDATRHGCQWSDYGAANFTGRIALMRRGSCFFQNKFYYAGAAGAAAALMVNDRPFNTIFSPDAANGQLIAMSGSSTYVPVIAQSVPAQMGDALFEAMDAGVKVRGKLQLSCDKVEEPSAEEVAMDDGCAEGKLEYVCVDEEADEDRICASCALEMTYNGVSACLRGNFLLPRKKENYLQHTNDLPFTAGENEIYWMGVLPGGGCTRSDYAGLSGKIVMVKNPTGCTPFQAARYASDAGVKAFLNYNNQRKSLHVSIEGVSSLVAMPVHAIDGDDSLALYDEVAKSAAFVTFADGDGRVAKKFGATFDVGPTHPRPPKANVTVEVVTEELAPEAIAAWEWSAAAVVSLVFIIILLGALVGLYLYQRSHAVEIPSAEGGSDGFALPLGLANMGIALSLLVIIAVVAFLLAYQAGQDATDTAVADGGKAVATTYNNSKENVDALATNLRTTVLSKVQQGLTSIVTTGEACTAAVTQNFMGLDDEGTWNSFAERLATYLDYANMVKVTEKWTMAVYTKNGFFANPNHITDYITSGGWDGTQKEGPVSVTNNGYEYNFLAMWYSWERYTSTPYALISSLQKNASMMLGGGIGNPLDMVKGKRRYSNSWYVSKETFPNIDEWIQQPMSVFTPMFNRNNVFQGVVEARAPLTDIGQLVTRIIRGEARLENCTAIVYDAVDKAIFATNAWFNIKHRAQVKKLSYAELRGLYTMYDLPPVQVSAAAKYMDKEHGTGPWNIGYGFSGEFEQQQYYQGSPLTLMHLEVKDGQVQDIGGANWETEIKDLLWRTPTCNTCIGSDAGRSVIEMDGSAILYIKKNLTRRTPIVAETAALKADGSWGSEKFEFNEEMENNGDPCIAFTDKTDIVKNETACMLRPNFLRAVGYTQEGYTISVRVKPAGNGYTEQQWTSETPHLFTDTTVGETNVRLFANGQLNLWILGYGCKTDAPPGGIPGGVWTTITASKRAWGCAVFVNGTMVDSGRISDSFWTSETEQPFVVGRRFKGLIEKVQVYNFSMTEPEALRHYEQGNLMRDAPERKWYLDVRPVFMNSAYRSGVDWQVMSLLPRDDVMRAVDRNNEITVRNLAIQEENTQKRLDQRTNETIMIVIAIAMASVFIFLVFNDALTKPFAQTAIVMTDAARMRIEDVPEKHSFLSELNAMNRAMSLMCKNLKEYKSYMPQTLGLDDDEDDESEAEQSVSMSMSRAAASEAASKASAASKSRGGVSSRSSKSMSRAAADAAAKRGGLVLSLAKKKVSFCVNNVTGFLQAVSSMSDGALVALHGEFVTLSLAAFSANKGVSETFSGDRFVASFNATKACGTHRTACVAAAHQFQHDLRTAYGEKYAAHSSAVSGDGRVGNCGNDQMKKFTFMTPTLTWSYALERLAKDLGVPIVADQFAVEDASNSFTVKTLLDVSFTKRSKKPVRVSKIVEKKESGESDEWMYELEEAAAKDPCSKWNAFAAAVLTADWDAANKLKEEAIAYDNGADFERLEAMMAGQDNSALVLKYH